MIARKVEYKVCTLVRRLAATRPEKFEPLVDSSVRLTRSAYAGLTGRWPRHKNLHNHIDLSVSRGEYVLPEHKWFPSEGRLLRIRRLGEAIAKLLNCILLERWGDAPDGYLWQ